MMIVLAQSGVGSAALWTGLMVLVVVGGVVGLFVLRRRLLSNAESPPTMGLTLHDLRQMRDRGEIDGVEFESLKRVVLGGIADPASPGRNPITGLPRDKAAPELSGERMRAAKRQRPG